MGFMQFHNHPQPRKIVQTPTLVLIVYEANYGLRQIFLDGRSLPGNDPQPWWYGYSVGRWEGDTLVVETSGLRDGGWLDVVGTPFTDAAKVTERFRRPNFGSLEIQVTVDDQKAFTKPWAVTINQRIMLDTDLIVLRDLAALIDAAAEGDLALVATERHREEPWNWFWADVVFANATAAAHRPRPDLGRRRRLRPRR